jgi:hypothetical protein
MLQQPHSPNTFGGNHFRERADILMTQALEQAKDGKWRAPTGQRIIK